MEYIRWGYQNTNPLVSRLGFGSTRFRQSDLRDQKGFNRCVELTEYAIDKGINYFDVAPTYASGLAEHILGTAFENAGVPVYVAAKSGLMIDKTSDDICRRIDTSLKLLHKDTLDFYHVWSVLNWQQYLEVCRPGGILEGIEKAKKQGLLEHICISLHCDPETTLRILKEKRFEGITISLNALNSEKWLSVLKVAEENKIAVATMNSLAGGMIPQYGMLFDGLDNSDDAVTVKALRFVLNLPGVNIALSGMTSEKEIDENCSAIDKLDTGSYKYSLSLPVKENLCSGCNYCAPCTVGIPIASCMQAYNHKILVDSSNHKKSSLEVANEVFTRVRANGVCFPDLKSCIKCQACEKRCTQKIPISERMNWLVHTAKEHGYSNESMTARLKEIEEQCADSKKIAIWPAADYASRTLDYWGNHEFENRCVFANSSYAMLGKDFRGSKIIGPESTEMETVDTIVIMHHRLQNEIKQELLDKYGNKYKIVCLHQESDIDWFNRTI